MNKLHVHSYYERNTALVVYRKMMLRCYRHGALPRAETLHKYQIPLVTVIVAFAEWVCRCENDALLHRQRRKLELLRLQYQNPVQPAQLSITQKDMFNYLTRFV